MNFFTQQLHIPYIFALLAILAEFLGSLGLLSGFLTRIAAFGIACNMVVAILIEHIPFGFFMNWTGAQKGEGYEYHLLALALLIPVTSVAQELSRSTEPCLRSELFVS